MAVNPDLNSLPIENIDKQINDIIQKPDESQYSGPDNGPAASEKKPETTEKDNQGADKPGADGKDGAGGGETAKPGEGGEMQFAGKFKTGDDLIKGTLELAKKLGIPESLLKRDIDRAKKDDNFEDIEERYKLLEAEFSRKTAAEKAAGGKDGQGADGAKKVDPPLSEAERVEQIKTWNNYVLESVNEHLANHPIRERFTKRGIDWPEKAEDWAALRDDPQTEYLYDQVVAIIKEKTHELEEFRNNYFQTMDAADAARGKAETSLRQYIASVNEKRNLGLSQEEIDADVKATMESNSPLVFEDRFGVAVPTETGAQKYWRAEIMEKYLDKAIENAQVDGRKQHAEDLQKMKDRTVESISSAKVPGSRSSSPKVDLRSDAEVRSLSEDDLNKHIARVAAKGLAD